MTDAELDTLAMDYMKKLSGQLLESQAGNLPADMLLDSKDATDAGQEGTQRKASG